MATTRKPTGPRDAAPRARPGPGPKRKRALEKKVAAERAAAPAKERALNNTQIRHLKGLGHHLDPVIQIGKEGITDGLVAATKEALLAHELIKVKVQAESPIDRKEAGPELAKLTAASFVQVLGRTLLLFKRHPNKPEIDLPRGQTSAKLD